MPDGKPITVFVDQLGSRHDLIETSEPGWSDLDVWDRGTRIAYARVEWPAAPVLELRDIYVEPAFRKRGIGRALIGFIIAIAQRNGLTTIQGIVSAGDVSATPALLDWYRALGFTVDESQPSRQRIADIGYTVTPA